MLMGDGAGIESHSQAKGLRNKALVFGKDQAIEAATKGPTDAIEEEKNEDSLEADHILVSKDKDVDLSTSSKHVKNKNRARANEFVFEQSVETITNLVAVFESVLLSMNKLAIVFGCEAEVADNIISTNDYVYSPPKQCTSVRSGLVIGIGESQAQSQSTDYEASSSAAKGGAC